MENKNDESKKDEVEVQWESRDQLIIRLPPAVDHTQVVYLPDANVGASVTESSVDLTNSDMNAFTTDKVEPKPVILELDYEPSTSRKSAACTQTLSEASATADPHPKSDAAAMVDKSEGTGAERLHNLLDLLHRVSCNLDAIEEHLSEDAVSAAMQQGPQQFCDLGTQTAELISPRRLRLDLIRTQPDSRPPCERTHHTITIAGNNLPPHQAVVRLTLCGRIGRSMADFIAAFCLCLQVNKDCVFCLGFFVAFVVSASFLTAFFYRTLSFTPSAYRVTAATPQHEFDPLKFNGGYYYIYNKNQRTFS